MPQVGIRGMLTEARQKRYGVLSLLGGNLDMVLGQVAAAEACRAPLILALNEGVTPHVPMDLAMPMLVAVAQRATVPVATILDHGRSIADVERAIDLGTSAVMFDGSGLAYDENVRITAEVVRIAHSVGVDVEAELGSIAGSAEWKPRDSGSEQPPAEPPKGVATDPELARDFVQKTNVDALAISFGNVHGTYQGDPCLDLDLVRQIRSQVEIPLVMHGGSGLDFGEYPIIVRSGISKIGYYTAAGIRAASFIKRELTQSANETAVYHDIIAMSIDFFRQDTARLIELVGCAGVV